MSYWINVVSKDHVLKGVSGGFTQANHGSPSMLRRIKKDDWILFYSPKTSLENGESLQAFTALGRVSDNEVYQYEMSPTFVPWRRNVIYEHVRDTPIKPLIGSLLFIENKEHWGYKFRFGAISISEQDFDLIRNNMLIR
jgi:hypothetical protein